MRSPAQVTDHGLVTSESVHLAIAVDFDGDEINGHASDGLAAPTPFSGWLGLMGVLDVLLSAAPTRGVTRPGVCVGLRFATAEAAEAFAVSDALHDALRGHGTTETSERGSNTTDPERPTLTIHQRSAMTSGHTSEGRRPPTTVVPALRCAPSARTTRPRPRTRLR